MGTQIPCRAVKNWICDFWNPPLFLLPSDVPSQKHLKEVHTPQETTSQPFSFLLVLLEEHPQKTPKNARHSHFIQAAHPSGTAPRGAMGPGPPHGARSGCGQDCPEGPQFASGGMARSQRGLRNLDRVWSHSTEVPPNRPAACSWKYLQESQALGELGR